MKIMKGLGMVLTILSPICFVLAHFLKRYHWSYDLSLSFGVIFWTIGTVIIFSIMENYGQGELWDVNPNILYQLVGQFEIKGAKYAVLIHSSRLGAEPFVCRADNEVPPGTKYCRISEIPRKEEHNESRYYLEPVTMGELDSLVPPVLVMWCPNCSSGQFPCSVRKS